MDKVISKSVNQLHMHIKQYLRVDELYIILYNSIVNTASLKGMQIHSVNDQL
jgi:hypothetical protein